MNFSKKIFVLSIFIIFISICGVYSAYNHQDSDGMPVISNETDTYGCCSIVLQLEGNHTMMSYRRDSNVTADVYIEQVNWHGIPAVKQYKTEHGYFNHVIITNNGWVIGLGGIDDGIDNEICENITANMITEDNSISEYGLKKIQEIKKPYGKGHVVIKAPNGNYGFATVNKLKTGTLKPGHYISIPNDYSLSRGGNISLDISDKVKTMNELAQSDLYGMDRREIVTYDYNVGEDGNTTDIYVSNEDGSYLGEDYIDCIDDVIFNNTVIKGKNIPIAPNYEKVGSITFTEEHSNVDNLIVLLFIVGFVFFVGILFFVVLKFVRFVRFHIRR
jgi:hypothetical protein